MTVKPDGRVVVRKIRAPLGYGLLNAAAVPAFLGFYLVSRSGFALAYFVVFAVTSMASGLLLAWFGADLTRTELKVNSWGRRRIPWSCVGAVTQESYFGGRRVVIWTEGGDRVPLRAPVVGIFGIGQRRFDEGFHTIGQWWLSHRDPSVVPRGADAGPPPTNVGPTATESGGWARP